MLDLEPAVAALARRVQALEDELAIHKVIARYGPASMPGLAPAPRPSSPTTASATSPSGGMEGRGAVRAMIGGARHQAMVGRCAHQMGPVIVTLDDDRARRSRPTRLRKGGE